MAAGNRLWRSGMLITTTKEIYEKLHKLCENCNRGLGMFKDSPELLQNAIQYLT